MLSAPASRLGPLGLAFLLAALPASAAPAPPAGGEPQVGKYFLDDTDFVLTVNVKEVARSPLIVKHYKKKLEAWLGKSLPRSLTRGLGIDPLKDVDTVTMLSGRSCYAGDARRDGPVFLLQGRFDRAKIVAGLNELDGAAWAYKEPGGSIYQMHTPSRRGSGLFVAVLDAHTLILSPRKQHVLDGLAKAAGKKTTRFAHKGVAARLKRLRPDVAVQAFGMGSMVLGSTIITTIDENGRRPTRTTHRTLLESGARELELGIAVKDDVQAHFLLTARDGGQLKVLSKTFQKELDALKEAARAQAAGQPKFAPAAQLLAGVSLKAADGAVILEGKATAEMIQAFIELSAAARMFR